jgi:hypothetical protein
VRCISWILIPALALGASALALADPPAKPTAKSSEMPKVVPASFDGDVRRLPPVPATFEPGERREMPEPPDQKPAVGPHPRRAAAIPAPLAAMPATVMDFDGLGEITQVLGGSVGAIYPPDPNGDVGPNHFVEAVNEAYAIFAKNGAFLAAFTQNSLWSGSGSTPCNGHARGDAVVLHDGVHDRWILTNLAYPDSFSTPFYECIAVSKTADPLRGGWWLYPVQVDTGGAGQPPVNGYNDYPRFGVWTDCLLMAANEYQAPSFSYIGQLFASFSLADMEAGLPLTSSIGLLSTSNDPFGMVPANLLGTTAPPGEPRWFVSQSKTGFAWEVRPFTPGANCGGTGTLGSPVNVLQTSYTTPVGTVPQGYPYPNLDTLGDRVMQKVQYRDVGGGESLWVTHSTMSATSIVQPQWAQIDVTGGIVGVLPVQQQIYAPDTTTHRWMGSLAVDAAGNMALGYSKMTYNGPTIAYAGRLAADPIDTLPQTETSLFSNLVITYDQPSNRWGDYTSMSVDPLDDCTFWYVNEYQSYGVGWQTHVGAFRFPSCTPSATTPDLVVTISHNGALLRGQNGATYTLVVTNVGTGPSAGLITVSAPAVAGVTVTDISGPGWSCTVGNATCTRNDIVFPGTSAPPVTVTVNVAAGSPSSLALTAHVSGGGETVSGNDSATDTTPLPQSGDVNLDGFVDVADVFYLINYLFAGGPAPQ